jgi:hypothetical protein
MIRLARLTHEELGKVARTGHSLRGARDIFVLGAVDELDLLGVKLVPIDRQHLGLKLRDVRLALPVYGGGENVDALG